MNTPNNTNKQYNEYSQINSKRFADALNFIGFDYYIFTNHEGKEVYTFKNTETFREALAKLIQLKKQYKKY